jgi:hypothetical protein
MKHYRITFALAAVLTIPCIGQQSTSQLTTISGKEHSELIDDATAYLHFLGRLSRITGETDEQFARRRLAFARRTKLGDNQIPLLLTAAVRVREEMKMFDSETPVNQRTQQSRDARAQVIMGIVAQLQQELGPGDAAALTAFVNTAIKPTIVIYVPKK